MKSVDCLVFDAYGTLFDVHTIVAPLERKFPGQGFELSKAWRVRQLEYTWLRSLMNRYEDFWRVTESALIASCKAGKVTLEAEARAEVMAAYLRLGIFPDVKPALSSLLGMPLAILSNGNPEMLQKVVENAGLQDVFTHVISVDELKIYKPNAATYELAAKKMRVEPSRIGFVSSNFFDVAGAKTFGFRTYWTNRSGIAGEELGVTPDATLKSLTELAAIVKS